MRQDFPGVPGSSQTGDSAGQQVQDRAHEVAGQAQEKAQQASAQARERLREQVSQRSTQAGEQVSATASDIRTVAEQLRAEGKEQPAKLAEQAAQRVERVGGYLTSSDADRLLNDVEEFMRKRPWAAGLGGVLAGLAVSRFLKASSTQRYYQISKFQGEESGPDRARGVRTVPQQPGLSEWQASSGTL